MVVHEHIGVQLELVTIPVDGEDLEELVVVVECAFKIDARFPWHAEKLSQHGEYVNSKV